MTKRPAVLIDRDGTTFSVKHHLVDGEVGCWHCYNGLAAFDAPVPVVAGLIASIRPGVTKIMTSGRMESVRPLFVAGLHKWGVEVDYLLMRRDKDQRRDSMVKQEMYDTQIKPHFDVKVVIDDRPSVVDQWRANGLHVIQVVDPGIDPPLLKGAAWD